MDRRVKERLVGASILAVLIVLIVPELLSGPAPPSAAARPAALGRPAASAPEPVRNITVDLTTSKAPAPEPADSSGASTAEPPPMPQAAAEGEAAASAAGADASRETRNDAAAPSQPAVTSPPAPPPPSTTVPVHTSTAAPSARQPGGAWAVQLGSFASRANADKLMRQLKTQGFAVYVVTGGTRNSVRYRVRVGPMTDRGAAAQSVARLKALGHAASFVPPAR